MVSIGLSIYCYPYLVYCSVRTELIAHAVSPDISPWRWILGNDVSFQLLFVNLPANAGPWLLIALYAWRVPMRALPDDGSPYPRRYCARCHYNLHGLDADLCPECGNRLNHTIPA
jgi:hypothetical protein